MTIFGGESAIFGIQTPKPLEGFPPGKVRIRMRSMEFVSAFVRDEHGIRHFYVGDSGEKWIPRFEIGRNKTR